MLSQSISLCLTNHTHNSKHSDKQLVFLKLTSIGKMGHFRKSHLQSQAEVGDNHDNSNVVSEFNYRIRVWQSVKIRITL